ncbi:glycosyltransferase family 4 protein [Thermocoleostomius sinensis]|jgi:glycosyltransferase involved in cell wall biosynthesis|uniref:Glycosyltransferase family 4 protein n=1 Tax=Thermocoleostomius sinensis A174 TaxID=2016057 RepID=A0A9E9CAD7_9CYAN|nr:glycosyltransferase family 4 protein [Thermocoleostomius sinensis]WAL62763.1 glycosyltransferase family 4 protein [Thermocoleostomius sinensis A174]
MSNTFRLGIVFTHPTQHHAPLWRKLNQQPGISVTALYLCNENQTSGDRHLGSSQPWDVDLTSGYEYEYLKTITGQVASKISKNLFHPGLFARLKPTNFDAVFLPSFYTLSYRLTVLLCKLRGIPIIMQNDATIISDDHYSRARQIALATLYPLMYSLADHWISSGDHNAIYLRHYGVSDAKMVRGCYPVDRERYEQTIAQGQDEIQRIRRELSWNNDTILYCFVGKYIARKNPFEFIEAITKAHRVDSRVRGIMIGGGELQAAIDQRLAELNGEVLNIGFVNQSQLPLYYAAMDAFISTSQFDPHPLVVSEAMAVGCPPILSDRCGNWGYSDTVQHRYNGLVYPYGQVDALVQAILSLTDAETRRLYSERSQEVFAGQDLNTELNAFLQVINRIRHAKNRVAEPNPDFANV